MTENGADYSLGEMVIGITTNTDFTGEGKITLSKGKTWISFNAKDYEGGGSKKELVAAVNLARWNRHTKPGETKVIFLLFTVWFKEGTFTIHVPGMVPVCCNIDPERGQEITCGVPRKPIMGIQLQHQLDLIENSEVRVALALKGVEPLALSDVGGFTGSGRAFVWPLQRKSALVDNLRENFKSLDFTDFKLVCDRLEFKCHKFMLAAMSPVFKRYLTNDSMEAQQGFVQIDDARPATVASLLGFIYTERISIDKSDSFVDDISQLLQLAEKYMIPSLTKKCCEILVYLMKAENAPDILRLARILDLKDLETKAQNYVASRAKDIIKTDAWNELLAEDPTVANQIIEKLLRK